MGHVFAGTSGWAYPSWKPEFYPPKLPAAKFLSYYGERLNSVEVNYTFRRFPSEKLLDGWAVATPADFQFAVKAHQNITHVKRLRGAGEFTKDFLASLHPLEHCKKLGPVLFQLPPFLKCDLPLLEDFLGGLPRAIRFAFEFRHASWFADDVFAVLEKHNAALCEAESEKLETPAVRTADFAYFRFRKASYSAEQRDRIAEKTAEFAERGDVYVYFKHEESPEGTRYAAELLSRGQRG